ncbi:MAG TPA: hypothetical protein VE028_03915 [Nitratidesulfovibrio sp.]|nr:hypothetical protein [Nitratidesulfovibrio sp.]
MARKPADGFDLKGFMRADFTPREEEVRIPELAGFFPEGADPIFRVRSLTGEELARVQEAAQRNRDLAALAAGLLSGSDAERVASLREALGVGDKVPDDMAKRMAMVEYGCVSPKLDMQVVIKLFRVLPVDMYGLATRISTLTGAGHVPGKAKPSGDATT